MKLKLKNQNVIFGGRILKHSLHDTSFSLCFQFYLHTTPEVQHHGQFTEQPINKATVLKCPQGS